MKRLFPVLTALFLFVGVNGAYAQAPADKEHSATETTKARAKEAASNDAVTHGTIKELTAGQKVVVAVDNAPDKSFDLADKDVKITMAKSLKVGDSVQVKEHSVMGKTKTAVITKHAMTK